MNVTIISQAENTGNKKIREECVRNSNSKSIPTVKIMNVDIAAINMEWLVDYIINNLQAIKGNYITVANVHTTVTAYENEEYCKIQNGGLMAIPDGGPLSVIGRKRGFQKMRRTTGPSLMGELFNVSCEEGIRHFFYGSTPEVLYALENKLKKNYNSLQIVGMYSPPFRPLCANEDEEIISIINKSKPDILWIGLGAPKQEQWMAKHKGKINALMIGVGAGFDYHAGTLKRAPVWMQERNLEWLYRLIQEPRRLFKRYWKTNWKFVWNAYLRGK